MNINDLVLCDRSTGHKAVRDRRAAGCTYCPETAVRQVLTHLLQRPQTGKPGTECLQHCFTLKISWRARDLITRWELTGFGVQPPIIFESPSILYLFNRFLPQDHAPHPHTCLHFDGSCFNLPR